MRIMVYSLKMGNAAYASAPKYENRDYFEANVYLLWGTWTLRD